MSDLKSSTSEFPICVIDEHGTCELVPEPTKPKTRVVFYTGYSPSFNENDIDEKSKNCYGSELCAKNVCEQLVKKGYDVHVFSDGNFISSSCNGVQYHNLFTYNDFQNKNEIDILVISRYIHFFIYSVPKVKKIFFWSHDTTVQPYFDGAKLSGEGMYFTLNMLHKIDRYVTLTNTHRNFVINEWLPAARALTDQEKQKFIVIGNGLREELFEQKEVQKIKNRFIYCSDPARGLDLTLQLISRIHALEESVTLEVFHSNINDAQRSKIECLPYVKYRGKVPQAELAIEMMKSEFWLYPTTFYETYCMTGLECQMAGVIPIVRKFGGLIDTVGDRGIQISMEDKSFENFCDEFVIRTIKLISDEAEKERFREIGMKFAREQKYENIANEWIKIIEE